MRTFAAAAATAALAAGMHVQNTLLSQLQATATAQGAGHTCHSTADRAKQISPDFNKWRFGGYRFIDMEFTHDNDALAWKDLHEAGVEDLDMSIIQWERAYSLFASKGKKLSGADGMTPDDINQGALGNCWFLSGASAVAEENGRMEKVFLNKDKDLNAQGVYGVNLYNLGVPMTVMVDDYLPLYKNWKGELATYFSDFGGDNSLWTAIIEKAFAKFHGNYAHIEGGDPGKAVQVLTGGPVVQYDHKKISADDLWAKIVEHDGAKDIMTCISPPGSDKTTDASGLVQGHAFTLLGAKQLSNGVRMLKIRNPHGSEKYHGNWGDNDPRWTDSLRAEVGGTNNTKDGVFHMAIEDFMYLFTDTRAVVYPDEGKGWDYFMMLDDKSAPSGNQYNCGKTCVHHKLFIVSDVDQTVHVTMHGHDDRDVSKSCMAQRPKPRSWKTPKGTNAFYMGSQTMSWDMKAGDQIPVEVEHDFSNPELARDWAVTALGMKGGVYVIYDEDKWETSKWHTDAQSGSDVRKPPTKKPALKKFDPAPFQEWVGKVSKEEAWTSKVHIEIHDDREWIAVVNHCPRAFKFDWMLQISQAEWNASKHSVSNTGKQLKDMAVCDMSDGWSARCKFSLMPGEAVGLVLEPGFTPNNVGYSNSHSRI